VVSRRAIIVDDMISSGSTMVKAAKLLRQKGAEEIYVFATHAVFSAEACSILQDSIIQDVYVTDSVYVPLEKYFPKLTVLTVADMVAKTIREEMPR